MIVTPEGILVTVEEASGLYKVPKGTLYRWAHEEKWARHGTPRACHWLLDEVQETYEARRQGGKVAFEDREG